MRSWTWGAHFGDEILGADFGDEILGAELGADLGTRSWGRTLVRGDPLIRRRSRCYTILTFCNSHNTSRMHFSLVIPSGISTKSIAE